MSEEPAVWVPTRWCPCVVCETWFENATLDRLICPPCLADAAGRTGRE